MLRIQSKNIYVARLKDTVELETENGFSTGVKQIVYHKPFVLKGSVREILNNKDLEMFGVENTIQSVITFKKTKTTVEETDIIFIDKIPLMKNGALKEKGLRVERIFKTSNYIIVGVTNQ